MQSPSDASSATSRALAPGRFDAAIFDFDGTLADTLPLITLAWNHALRPLFGRDFSISEVVDRFGPTDAVMLQRELAGRPEAEVSQVIENYFAHYESAHDAAYAFEGTGQMLADVRAAGFKVGLMTGKGRRAADITLRLLGWQDAFDYVVTGDDTTRPKPDPEGILAVARALEVEHARCIYVGDMPVDVGAARAAGMASVAAGWNAYGAEVLRAATPDFWAATPADVLRFLTQAPAST
jgi:HAD superfamily hydrolase (TIGR01509 family)